MTAQLLRLTALVGDREVVFTRGEADQVVVLKNVITYDHTICRIPRVITNTAQLDTAARAICRYAGILVEDDEAPPASVRELIVDACAMLRPR